MKFILSNKTKYCTKEIIKLLKIITLALFTILLIIFIKFKPIYQVTLGGEVIGYVKSKTVMEDLINKKVLTLDNICAVTTSLEEEPTYKLILASQKTTNEEEIISVLSEEKTTLYRVYAILVNEEEETYVNTFEEAESIKEEMQSQYEDLTDVNISILEKYTTNIDELGTVELATAKASIDTELRIIQDEQEKIASATFNGVYFSTKPITGTITSRYGVVESDIRDHAHSGLDIAAPKGTPIKAAADGVVSYSGTLGGYGNLIIIDHENGVQSYYGHCSKLYSNVGDTVTAGDVIAAVGSTGNSTGNHLHFEIRLNGSTVNPQKYIYN